MDSLKYQFWLSIRKRLRHRLKEDLVKAVMAEYFKQKQVDAYATGKGEAGADFHIDGVAVEVKGEGLDYARLLEQLVLYAFRQREVQLAMPFDAVTADGLLRLYLLEGMVKELRNKSLKLYLVSDKDETFYHIKEFSSVTQLFLYEMNHFDPLVETVQSSVKLAEALGNVPDAKVREIAKVAGETAFDTDFAVGRILGEVMKKFPYIMVAKSNVKL